MKTLLLTLFFTTPIFACVTPSPQQFVVSKIILPGQPIPYQDGSQRAPFINLKNALVNGKAKDFCTTSIKLANGSYFYDGSPITNNVTIVGTERANTIIKGGLFVNGAINLSLEKITLQNAGTRLIYIQGGDLKLKEVTIKDYVFKQARPFAHPSAIQIINSQARIIGLEALNSEQPILRIEGANSRVKAFGFTINNTSISDYADYAAVPANYSAAVEVTDGALANFMLTEIKAVEFAGILATKGARVYGAQVAVRNIFKSNPATKTMVGGVLAFNSTLHMNGYRINNSHQAGVGILESFVTLQNGALEWSNYGLVDINDVVNGQNGYDTKACAFSSELKSIIQNNTEQDYLHVGDFPVPNSPIPIPCPSNMECPETAPAPIPQKPPVVCPAVEII